MHPIVGTAGRPRIGHRIEPDLIPRVEKGRDGYGVRRRDSDREDRLSVVRANASTGFPQALMSPVLSPSAETGRRCGCGTRSSARYWIRPSAPGRIDRRAVGPIVWHGRQPRWLIRAQVARAGAAVIAFRWSSADAWSSLL